MGLFVLASLGLSMYIWSMTLYNVYKPLASTLSAAAPSMHPMSVLTAIQAAFKKPEDTTVDKTTKRSGRRRKNLTLAEAQREELRESLKILFIWLACKGTEPVFDNTFGYVVPFYTLIKVFFLIIFARFRTQLSVHLFDSFVIPLGRPNTPLINSTAFTNLILPSLRFLLSLPLVHLTAVIQRTLNSFLNSWGNEGDGDVAEEMDQDKARRRRQTIEAERVPPPRVTVSSRHASTSVLRRDGKDGPGGGSGNIRSGSSLRYQKSMDTLSSRSMASSSRNLASTLGQRSVSSRMTPNTQETYNQLDSLPHAPQGFNDKVQNTQSRSISGPSNAVVSSTSMKPFAYIPNNSSSSIHSIPNDIVPPPDGITRSYLPATSPMKMPGSLVNSPVKNFSTMDEIEGTEETTMSIKPDPSADETVVNSTGVKTSNSGERHSTPEMILDVENQKKGSTVKKSTTTKRKVNEMEDFPEGKETKKRASPKKSTARSAMAEKRTKTLAVRDVIDSSKNKKGEEGKENEELSSTLPRSRSKRSVRAPSKEDDDGETRAGTTKTPRTVRSRSKN